MCVKKEDDSEKYCMQNGTVAAMAWISMKVYNVIANITLEVLNNIQRAK